MAAAADLAAATAGGACDLLGDGAALLLPAIWPARQSGLPGNLACLAAAVLRLYGAGYPAENPAGTQQIPFLYNSKNKSRF